jgi:hypothetical protein
VSKEGNMAAHANFCTRASNHRQSIHSDDKLKKKYAHAGKHKVAVRVVDDKILKTLEDATQIVIYQLSILHQTNVQY